MPLTCCNNCPPDCNACTADYKNIHASKKGADTYLNGHAKGWPMDQKAEDTFDLPTIDAGTITGRFVKPEPLDIQDDRPEYKAEFTSDGGAVLVLYTPAKIIAHFDTMADAETAAKALNELKGY